MIAFIIFLSQVSRRFLLSVSGMGATESTYSQLVRACIDAEDADRYVHAVTEKCKGEGASSLQNQNVIDRASCCKAAKRRGETHDCCRHQICWSGSVLSQNTTGVGEMQHDRCGHKFALEREQVLLQDTKTWQKWSLIFVEGK